MNSLILGIKTGICVSISIMIAKLLRLEYPFFVVLAVIMPVQDTFMTSYKSGKYRMLGTFIGALVGVLGYFVKVGSAIISGIGVAFIIWLCNFLKWPQSAPIGGIVFMAIMVNIKEKNPIYYSFNRVLDTLVGVCVTITVHYIMSYRRKQNI